jgi:hypothetical protein
MAFNNKNRLLYYLLVQEETQKFYEPGVTTYAGVFNKYIKPNFPMSYGTYIKIIGINVKKELAEIELQEKEQKYKTQ